MFHFLRRFAFKRSQPEAQRDPLDAPSFNKRGVRRMRKGLRDEARADFETALVHDGRYAPAMMNLGNIAFEAGEALEAVRWYEAAIAADPDYALVHANLASAYKVLGRYDDAVAAMRRARRLEVRRGWKPSRRS